MNVRTVVSDIVTGIALICIVLLTGLTLRRELGRSTAPSRPPPPKPVQVDNWEELIAVGHRWGPPGAPVTILEFIDFRCPACRTFALGAASTIERRYPDQVAFVVRHWPLPYHRLASPAAQAAECAAVEGRFYEIYRLFFEKQDSLGLKSFRSYGAESGVTDLDAFEECMHDPEVARRISADSAAAVAAGGTGTPTVIVNGLRLPSPPDSARLDELIREALADRARQ